MQGKGSQGGLFHITHRCHNRAFPLKFARDRDAYREKLREHAHKFRVWVLDYCLTANHVHLLMDADDPRELSRFMQEVAGEFARSYNRRKHRMNAVWGDNYHATRVESGRYLWECLCYIELNMNRCGVVKHPREWKWVGYHEIMGNRRRYRLIDLHRLCWRLGNNGLEEVRENLEASLADRIARGQVRREGLWTESLGVGSRGFVERLKPQIASRRRTETGESSQCMWCLKETAPRYKLETTSKSEPKPYSWT